MYLPCSQAMHGCGLGLVVTATLYWPTTQSVQSVAASWPALAVVLPATQFVHDVDPDVAYEPPLHVMHCADDVLPDVAEYVPAAHAVHPPDTDVWPSLPFCMPCGQYEVLQLVCFAASWYRPVAHAIHPVPGADAALPASQGVHDTALTLLAPAAEPVPESQPLHGDTLAVF